MIEAYVTLKIENKVGFIEFYHPQHNAMPSDVLSQLENTIKSAGNNNEIAVVVLKSGGDRTFCAGASFNELIAIEDPHAGQLFFSGFAKVINAMRKCPKLIIGRIQGKAVGGGVGLAAATDYCFATKYASIKLSELSIGIGPFVIEPAVTRRVGLNAMSQMTLDAETFFDAKWAKEKGLYTEVYDDVVKMDQELNNFTQKLAGYNLEALSEMKKVLWKDTENWDNLLIERAKISGKLVLSEFTKHTLKRFK
ncbi:enoyl-CoA hydratase/isomerase family protein [Aestuariibaculum sediminum]|uniref:Enoyl-CoA hydratase/isomerase family protein n=1 Tax=Aestuariibaculum sediminum TaxID=2770637 RepID=A0A8J6UI04_9FLAO|nr:enoyl-CoA hydratase/isomerase family protein [Aestuariibaculum sediminum]MBD0833626.1 enoyl-CoA hydratase/isomerase family protein [Aestuariibaculum sediminum]